MLVEISMDEIQQYLMAQGFDLLGEGVGFSSEEEVQETCDLVLRLRDNIFCTRVHRKGSSLPRALDVTLRVGHFLDDVRGVASDARVEVWMKEVCFDGQKRVQCPLAHDEENVSQAAPGDRESMIRP
ncbi:MAG TPA: hypothetical protein PKW35_12925 [Nannocystaceae bacterium]|nr:hypothetical protein [Nannocystaceae bacterium]